MPVNIQEACWRAWVTLPGALLQQQLQFWTFWSPLVCFRIRTEPPRLETFLCIYIYIYVEREREREREREQVEPLQSDLEGHL